MHASRFTSSIVVATASLLLSCSDVAGPPDETPVGRYVLDSLPSWSEYAPLLPSADLATGTTADREELVGAARYVCAVTPHSLTETPAEIVMYEPNASIMWVGNLIQGRSYKGGLGTFQELSIRQRDTLRLSIDLLTGNNFAIVPNPSLTTVQAAVGDLIQRAQDAGHRAGTSVHFDSRLSHSTAQAVLKLGLSASFLGAEAKVTLERERNASQHTVIAHFVQKMFTIAIELPQSPGSFFTDDLTPALLDEQRIAGNIGPDNLPVYIASITYGRTLTYALTTTHSEDRMEAAISASYKGFGFSGSGYDSTELKQTLDQDNIRFTAIGGEGQNVLSLITQGQLASYFAADAPLTSARPISYQINYLGDNRLARVSETTDYLLSDCAAIPPDTIISDFEIDNEDWTLEGATTSAAKRGDRAAQDGTWFVRGEDGNVRAGNVMYFRAPGKFRGDKSAYYGGALSFFVRWLVTNGGFFGDGQPLAAADILILGANGATLKYRFGRDNWAEDQWDFRQVPLDTRAAWRVGGALATEQQIRDVLANVLQLKIRGEYRDLAADIGYLDRVVLSKPPPTASASH